MARASFSRWLFQGPGGLIEKLDVLFTEGNRTVKLFAHTLETLGPSSLKCAAPGASAPNREGVRQGRHVPSEVAAARCRGRSPHWAPAHGMGLLSRSRRSESETDLAPGRESGRWQGGRTRGAPRGEPDPAWLPGATCVPCLPAASVPKGSSYATCRPLPTSGPPPPSCKSPEESRAFYQPQILTYSYLHAFCVVK